MPAAARVNKKDNFAHCSDRSGGTRPATPHSPAAILVAEVSDTPFVHLHCHTDYSLLDGAVQFYNAAKAKGVHPVLGCEALR